jgi:hypothetical protein
LVRRAGNGAREKEGEPTWRSLTFEPCLDVSQPVDLHLAIRSNAICARSLTADASNTKLEVLDCAGEDLEIGHCGSLAALAGLRNLALVEIDWNQWIWWKEATIDRRDSAMASVDRLLMRKVSDVEETTSQ